MIRSNGGNNNTLILIILIGLLIAFGVYCVWGKGNKPEEYTKPSKISNEDVEIIQPADSNILEEYTEGSPKEDTEMIEPGDDDDEDNEIISYL
uniref:Uncharacterized protein n=1 Tax=Marseillevirus LCMAC101 TaxID=2506602 RepID=A0A481YS68_9VIRU|nr:MAG: hypothetical protein LCMAC101_04840 [Marseillevirus LCMAC101]